MKGSFLDRFKAVPANKEKVARTLNELMALETPPGGVEVTTQEALVLLRGGATVRNSDEKGLGKVQKYFMGPKTFTWTSTRSDEDFPSNMIANAAA